MSESVSSPLLSEFFTKDNIYCLVDKAPYIFPISILKETSPLIVTNNENITKETKPSIIVVNENFDLDLLDLILARTIKLDDTPDGIGLMMSQYRELHRIYNFFQFNKDLDNYVSLYECYSNVIDGKSETKSSCCSIVNLQMFIVANYEHMIDKSGSVSLRLEYIHKGEKTLICGVYPYYYMNRDLSIIYVDDNKKQTLIEYNLFDEYIIIPMPTTTTDHNAQCPHKNESNFVLDCSNTNNVTFTKRNIDNSNPANIHYV